MGPEQVLKWGVIIFFAFIGVACLTWALSKWRESKRRREEAGLPPPPPAATPIPERRSWVVGRTDRDPGHWEVLYRFPDGKVEVRQEPERSFGHSIGQLN